MIRMDDSILALYNDNLITKDNALYYSHKPSELAKKLNDFQKIKRASKTDSLYFIINNLGGVINLYSF